MGVHVHVECISSDQEQRAEIASLPLPPKKQGFLPTPNPTKQTNKTTTKINKTQHTEDNLRSSVLQSVA